MFLFTKEIILICYILGLLLGVSGLTVAILSNKKKKIKLGVACAMMLISLLIACCYDMIIYYGDYVIGGWNNLKTMRIGNCIIAANMFMWINLQENILRREALKQFANIVKKYLVFYVGMWGILTLFLGIEQLYTLKWMLLVTDLMLIIGFMSVAIAHIIYISVADRKNELYFMIIVTAMLIWNYISYFWSETSVYWGNSHFIREPLDLTIFFWLIINTAMIWFVYRFVFLPLFGHEATVEENVVATKNTAERITEVCNQYKLTQREKELIELIYSGKTNKEIAEMLFLAESTVKTHVYNIFRKMEVKNRIEVICIINGDAIEHEKMNI